MRILALALSVLVVAGPPGASGSRSGSSGTLAFLAGHNVVELDLSTGTRRIVLRDAADSPLRWSGDGRLVSIGGQVIGGPKLPATDLAWAPAGESAAYQTTAGAIAVWTPAGGRMQVVPASWGARSFAWGPSGEIALGRKHPAAANPTGGEEVWVWRAGRLRRIVGPLHGDTTPLVAGFARDGSVLWWDDLYDSSSIAADGLTLFAGRTRLATTLVFPDYVVRCGGRLALVVGRYRETTAGKRITLGGRDISDDPALSWVSPSCNADGSLVVAAAGRNTMDIRYDGSEHRAIWRLLPSRRRLTDPPVGATDEDPEVLADGSILFVRSHVTTRQLAGTWNATTHGTLELLSDGKLTRLADLTTNNDLDYYGHYGWPARVAVAP